MAIFRSRKAKNADAANRAAPAHTHSGSSDSNTLPYNEGLTKPQVKRATRTRRTWALISSFFLFVSVIFLILVEIGQIYDRKVLVDIYFLKLDLTHIVPTTIPNSVLINSIARTLGLHDFYTVGLWGFCEGYNNQGVTYCSPPQTLYWFNPLEILQNELLSGATIALPSDIYNILDLIKEVSHWMFGLFLAGICLNFVMIFLQPLSVISRWMALLIMIFTFLGALFTTVATVIATVMFIIFSNVATSVAELNIGASIGKEMFAFMWIGAACSIIPWIIQLCLCCCCASRRDVKKGKKRGNKKAYEINGAGYSEKQQKQKRGPFGRKNKA